MALNTSKCNPVMTLGFKGLMWLYEGTVCVVDWIQASVNMMTVKHGGSCHNRAAGGTQNCTATTLQSIATVHDKISRQVLWDTRRRTYKRRH